jgi:hypothetical protein
LRQQVASLEACARLRGRVLGVLGGVLLALGVAAALGVVDVRQQLVSCRAKLVESRQAHSALVHGDAGAAPVPPGHRGAGSAHLTGA